MIFKAGELYQVIWKAIIRPPRDTYQLSELGPEAFSFDDYTIKRRDFELVNRRRLVLQCSLFEPISSPKKLAPSSYPCVVYLHGNCSSRLEALNCGCLRALLPLGIAVCCFDFSGSGRSQGEYVSLGWYEKEDLECVINYLRSLDQITSIGLWGRSMGAVTACLYADSDPTIAGMVVDSPFSSLRRLADELVYDFVGWKIPKLLINPALSMVRSSVQARAKFDIDLLKPIENCERSFVPALFVAASHDTFIRPQHCRDMHGAYAGDKNMIIVSGTHNSQRPSFLMDSIAIFFQFALQISSSPSSSQDLWESVAVSLALNERSRRQQILDKQVAKRVSDTAKRSKTKGAKKSQATQLETATKEQQASSSVDSKDDDPTLETALAQMMIFESIQHDKVFDCTCTDTVLDDPVQPSATNSAATHQSLPLINMPLAPHRLPDPMTSPKKLKISF